MELESLLWDYRSAASQSMTIKDLKCVDGAVFLYSGDKALTIKI